VDLKFLKVVGYELKIDEIKERINWLKDLFKTFIMILIATIAGISKLYLDKNYNNILFYLGVGISFFVTIWILILFFKINKEIVKLGELE